MLQISENKVSVDTSKYKAFDKANLSKSNVNFRRFLLILFSILFIILFLPWTQNIRAKGYVTTLTPDQRPQTIHATIAGRIERWYVREGQQVRKGDTIVYLSETKTDYFDPKLLDRTAEQVNAKENSVINYDGKAGALDEQIKQTRTELKFKKEQLLNKISQNKLKIEADRNDLAAAKIDLETETKQLIRTEELFKQGLKSLTDLENKRLKLQQTQAKQVVFENKYQQSIQEADNLKFQISGIEGEYQGKIAKSASEKFSTLSDKFEAQGNVSKLKNQYSNYEKRAKFYYITAPIDCYITKAATVGIGETVKEGEAIVSTIPSVFDLAVELFIDPIDYPLAHIGAPVRFIFDGWPAFIFSGWPNSSVGTYSGKVWAIDNVANEKGKYRVIVAPDSSQTHWPDALRPGSGANGFALLENVPVWYEIWRQLNGFPPDFYAEKAEKKDGEKK